MSEVKIPLSDRAVLQLPPPANGRYTVRDQDLKGFSVVVGAKRKTFTVQGEFWEDGKRFAKTVSIGHAGDISVREARIKAKALLAKIVSGELQREEAEAAAAAAAMQTPVQNKGVTLRVAWERYRTAHMERKERSEATIKGYADHVERLLADWLDTPLQEIGEDPARVAERHDRLTKENGPSAGNGAMRTLRAIYNHARKSHRNLPPENPTLAVDWNTERRRDTAMGVADVPGWFDQARRMRHQVRREFHLFTLLSGSRPGALLQARIEHVNFRERILHIPRPKGGAKRAFDIPLSRPMIRCLIRAMRAGRDMLPEQARTWLFVGESEDGHMVEHKEDRRVLAKWGNDLRQTYRTLGAEAELSEIDMHLLMNHSLPGVNAGYITRAKLLSTHLRTGQEKLSSLIVRASGAKTLAWPFLPSRKIGDPVTDPTPPDPRTKAARAA
uniref:Integrase family protein n=1 Tax=Caulobacter sp. (strain K31) TaxID=366602 RepID=B0T6J1_CAUSK